MTVLVLIMFGVFSIIFFYSVVLCSQFALTCCFRGKRSSTCAYFLWFCSCGTSMHLYYLGRDLQLFLYWITCGFFGLSFCRDPIRMSDYLRHANVEELSTEKKSQGEVVEWEDSCRVYNYQLREYIQEKQQHPTTSRKKPIPPQPLFSWGRFIASVFLSAAFKYLFSLLFPSEYYVEDGLDDSGSVQYTTDPVASYTSSTAGVVFAFLLISNVGEQTINISTLLSPIPFALGLSAVMEMESPAFLLWCGCFMMWCNNRKFRTDTYPKTGCCFRSFKLTMWLLTFLGLLFGGLYNHGNIPMTVGGEQQKIKISSLYSTLHGQYSRWRNSTEGAEFFHNLGNIWVQFSDRIEREGWSSIFEELQSNLMNDVENNALKLLELEAGATCGEIKKQFRQLSRKYHPDKNPGDKDASAKYMDLNAARDQLLESCSDDRPASRQEPQFQRVRPKQKAERKKPFRNKPKRKKRPKSEL